MTVRDSFALAVSAVGPLESVAVTVTVVVPDAVGVPLSTPGAGQGQAGRQCAGSDRPGDRGAPAGRGQG